MMRAWLPIEKCYEELGSERYTAETEVVPDNWALMSEEEKEAVDLENFPTEVYEFRGAKALAQARRKAKQLLRVSAFGQARVQRQIVDWYVEEDRFAEWADVGDPEYID